MRILRTAFVLSLLAAAPAAAQPGRVGPQPGEELADRVIAVVGDTTLLLSDLFQEVQRLAAAGQPVPEDPEGRAALLQQIATERIDDLLLAEAAERASITVLDQEVETMVEQQLTQVRRSFPSEGAFLNALQQSGTTLDEYRATIARQARDQTRVRRFLGQRVSRMPLPPVSDAEARAYFERQREQLGTRPANVSFQQVIVAPEPADSALAVARRQAEEVLAKLNAGEDFEVLARRFSADSVSAAQGGDLGWFRQGMMVPEFDAAVWSLRPGQTSGLVKTDFGFHVIRLEKVRGPERQARHILISPEVTPADVQRARERADSVATAVRGGARITDLAPLYDTPAEVVVNRNAVLSRLPAEYVTAFDAAQPGTVVGPFQVAGLRGRPSFAVARVTERQDQGSYEFADVAEQARDRVREQKQIEQLLAELRRDFHVAVFL